MRKNQILSFPSSYLILNDRARTAAVLPILWEGTPYTIRNGDLGEMANFLGGE
jgi:hypothetical protein